MAESKTDDSNNNEKVTKKTKKMVVMTEHKKKRHLLKGMANVKKKLQELCVLCDVQAFLLCDSLPAQTWPPDEAALSSLVSRFRSSKSAREGVQMPGLQQEKSCLGNLLYLVSRTRNLEGMTVEELQGVLGQVKAMEVTVRQQLESVEVEKLDLTLSLSS